MGNFYGNILEGMDDVQGGKYAKFSKDTYYGKNSTNEVVQVILDILSGVILPDSRYRYNNIEEGINSFDITEAFGMLSADLKSDVFLKLYGIFKNSSFNVGMKTLTNPLLNEGFIFFFDNIIYGHISFDEKIPSELMLIFSISSTLKETILMYRDKDQLAIDIKNVYTEKDVEVDENGDPIVNEFGEYIEKKYIDNFKKEKVSSIIDKLFKGKTIDTIGDVISSNNKTIKTVKKEEFKKNLDSTPEQVKSEPQSNNVDKLNKSIVDTVGKEIIFARLEVINGRKTYVAKNYNDEILQSLFDISFGRLPFDAQIVYMHSPNSDKLGKEIRLILNGQDTDLYLSNEDLAYIFYQYMKNFIEQPTELKKGNPISSNGIVLNTSIFPPDLGIKLLIFVMFYNKEKGRKLNELHIPQQMVLMFGLDKFDTKSLFVGSFLYEIELDALLSGYIDDASRYSVYDENDEYKGSEIDIKLNADIRKFFNNLGFKLRTEIEYSEMSRRQKIKDDIEYTNRRNESIRKQELLDIERKKRIDKNKQEKEDRKNYAISREEELSKWYQEKLNHASNPYNKSVKPIFRLIYRKPDYQFDDIGNYYSFDKFKEDFKVFVYYPPNEDGVLRLFQDISNGIFKVNQDVFKFDDGLTIGLFLTDSSELNFFENKNNKISFKLDLSDKKEILGYSYKEDSYFIETIVSFFCLNNELFSYYILPEILSGNLISTEYLMYNEYYSRMFRIIQLLNVSLVLSLYYGRIKKDANVSVLGLGNMTVIDYINKKVTDIVNKISHISRHEDIEKFFIDIKNGVTPEQAKSKFQSNDISKLNKSIIDTPKEVEKVKAPASLLNYVTSQKDKKLLQLLDDTYWDTKLTAQQIETKSKIIINKLSDINAVTDSGETALYIVLSRENTKETVKAMKDVVSLIMESGYDLNKPIHPINEYKKPTFIEIVVVNSLEEGIDRTSGKGYDLAEFLYNCGADYFNKENANGKSGYEFAKLNSDTKTVGFLEDISKKPRVNPFAKK